MSEVLLNGSLLAASVIVLGYLLYSLLFPERF